MTPVMIWDLHCHLGGFNGRTPDEKMAEMVRLADRMGIDRLCVYMGYPFDRPFHPSETAVLYGLANTARRSLTIRRVA